MRLHPRAMRAPFLTSRSILHWPALRVRGLHTCPLSTYAQLVQVGRLKEDESQNAAMLHLRTLFENIHGAQAGCSEQSSDYGIGSTAVEPLSGVYLHGSVGSGKTMLMDLFVEACGDAAQRLHFHELMLEVHAELHRLHMSRPRTVVQSKFGLPMFKFGDMEEAGEALRPPPTMEESHTGAHLVRRQHSQRAEVVAATVWPTVLRRHRLRASMIRVESFIDGPLASSSREDSA